MVGQCGLSSESGLKYTQRHDTIHNNVRTHVHSQFFRVYTHDGGMCSLAALVRRLGLSERYLTDLPIPAPLTTTTCRKMVH
jgi:hypothetical protein